MRLYEKGPQNYAPGRLRRALQPSRFEHPSLDLDGLDQVFDAGDCLILKVFVRTARDRHLGADDVMISLGHRRILLLASDTSLRNVRERVEGYREALVEADVSEFENVLVAGHNDAVRARQALLPVLAGPERPSALCRDPDHDHWGPANPLGSGAGTAKGHFVARVRRF
jgi:hypothetical protein